MVQQKDLFDDSVMTFGEHLEVLRYHLIRAIIGLAIGTILCLIFGESIIRVIRQPIDAALDRYSLSAKKPDVKDDVEGFNFFATVGKWVQDQFYPPPPPPPEARKTATGITDEATLQKVVTMDLSAFELLKQLHEVDPEHFAAPSEALQDRMLRLDAISDDFEGLRRAIKKIDDPITLNVQEAFMTYMKVSFISGLIVSSPWVFYQLWLFVAAGLYPHERKYVYTYLPVSLGLFLGGAAFCFYAVFPKVLDFLLGFNLRMGLTAQIRISEWINFAVLMPLLFGVSFELPLVMLFMQKISIFQVQDYRERRRLAILAIAFVSMILTPTPDPMSMMLMMGPLLALYELGIWMCVLAHKPESVESAAA